MAKTLQIEMIVPDKGTYTCNFNIDRSLRDILFSRWKKQWLRLSCPGWPDILGVHLYVKYLNSNIIQLKLRVSNGSVNKDGTGFCGKVYFKSLTVRLNEPKSIITIPRVLETVSGNQWTIAPLLPNNDNHVMLPRWIIEREFCVCDSGYEQQALATLKRSNVSIPNVVSGYGPLDITMPPVNRASYTTLCSQAIAIMESALRTGAQGTFTGLVDLETNNIGIWHPHGNREAYAFGGLDINPYTGFAQVKESVYLSSLLHIANIDRMPIACFDINTGEPIRSHEWTNRDLIHAALTKGEIGYENNLELLAFLVGNYNNYKYPVFNPGNTCSYETSLRSYCAHDVAHSRRGSIHAETLWNYEQNPMAADDIIMLFEHARQSDFSDRADEMIAPPPHNPYQYIPKSLTKLAVNTQNHNGVNVDRAFGWSMYHGALVETIRTGYAIGWLNKAISVYARGADILHGIVQREYHTPHMPNNVEGTQCFHTAILAFGACAALRYVNTVDTAEAKKALLRLCTQFYGDNSLKLIPYTYNASQYGPPHWVWTYQNTQKITPLDNAHASTSGDIAHTLAVFAETYRLTGINLVLRVSLKHWVRANNLQDRWNYLQSGVSMLDRAQTAGYEAAILPLK